MVEKIVYSLIESPGHADYSAIYQRLGMKNLAFTAVRKAIAQLKKQPADYVVAEFFYGFANNYAGVNLSNLDVFLYSLQKYSPDAKVIVLANKVDKPHAGKLEALFPIYAVLDQPVRSTDIEHLLVD